MRIVVVDPSRTVLKALSKLLESEGHAVSVFVDAGEALDFIKAERDVSVLITSVELSPMAGIELCWNTAADRLRPDDLHHSDVLQLGRAASNQRPR
jgi:two-component system, cell cycle response regulator